MKKIDNFKIGIIGLGYVGLPLALSFGKKFNTIGFDLKKKRIEQLKKSKDINLESSFKDFISAKKILFSNNINDLKECNFYIITVPTPINRNKKPDLEALKSASKSVAKLLNKGDIIVFESTVYPGATEEVCIPLVEKHSNYIANKDFFYGYSPERINPGDKKNNLVNTIKIVSGSSVHSAKIIKKIYETILKNKTYLVSNIKTAEAAKIIENIQRDVNIALVNEFSNIFNKLGIDTLKVLEAASTKWNFINFSPGLVGGHCIGVDPYYLSFKAREVGYNPIVTLSGRDTNEYMSKEIFYRIIELMEKKKIKTKKAKVLILGYTFKENCSDTRNTKVSNLISHFLKKNMLIDVFDPLIKNLKFNEMNVNFIKKFDNKKYDIIILAVPHKYFLRFPLEKIKQLGKKKNVIFDVKGVLKKENVDGRL